MLKQVKVKVGDESITGSIYKDELIIANVIDVGDMININGKERGVISSLVDTRDNILKIKLADASPKKGAKNGKSPKGRD